MSYKHLDERSVYEERYDRHTVEECRWYEDTFLSLKNAEGFSPRDIQKGSQQMMVLTLFQLTSDRCLEREETISRWMERDRQRDAMMERAQTPLIRCSSCQRVMECIHSHLNLGFGKNEPDKMELFLACKECQQSRHVYEDGREIIREPTLCTKCNREVDTERKEKDGKRYYVETCAHCGHVEETLSLLDEKKKEPSQEEIDRFNRDKQRFCISNDQAQRYVRWKERTKELDDKKKEHELNLELYDKLKEIKKLTIAGVEERLTSAIKKADYGDLHITMPASERDIVLHFSARDLKVNRKEQDSRQTLEKMIQEVLSETNWSLASEGVSYRLGFLSGRIRGYESQEDLEKLTRSRMKKKPAKKKSEMPIEF